MQRVFLVALSALVLSLFSVPASAQEKDWSNVEKLLWALYGASYAKDSSIDRIRFKGEVNCHKPSIELNEKINFPEVSLTVGKIFATGAISADKVRIRESFVWDQTNSGVVIKVKYNGRQEVLGAIITCNPTYDPNKLLFETSPPTWFKIK